MKSVKKFYEYKRSYDFGECLGRKSKRFCKKRAHKRLRKQVVI